MWCHFMGNQVCKFVIFLYVYITVMYACFDEYFCRAPWAKILVMPVARYAFVRHIHQVDYSVLAFYRFRESGRFAALA